MRALRTGLVMMMMTVASSAAARGQASPQGNWPQFRGPHAGGVAEGHALPTSWNLESGENIRWKTAVPGLGLSSPVVWGDKIFLTTAVATEGGSSGDLRVGLYGDIAPVKEDTTYSWRVLCFNKADGTLAWDKEATQGVPKIKRHPKSSHANASVATDGQRVVAFFGSEGLYCFDMQGEIKWKKDLGVLDSGFFMVKTAQWGFGSSPVLHEGKVIVQCDVQKDSFIAAFDAQDGRELWRTARDEVPTWSTPTIHREGDRVQVICNGWKRIAGYDANDGKELWWLRGGGDIPVPTPIVSQGLIFITNAHGMAAPIYAIRTTASGNIAPPSGQTSNEMIPWSRPRNGNYMQTPLVYGEHLYMCADNGVLACYDVRTGEQKFRARLGTGGSGFTASAVAGGGNLYLTSEDGDIYVVPAGAEFKLGGINPMGEICMATPAISEGLILVRTDKHLVAVGLPRSE